jgi:hypothetical protein
LSQRGRKLRATAKIVAGGHNPGSGSWRTVATATEDRGISIAHGGTNFIMSKTQIHPLPFRLLK